MTDPPSVASALTDLATEAGDQPLALSDIHDRARRLRVRRGAGRAAIVAVCCAGLAAGISLAGTGGSQRTQISAMVPAPVALTQCTTLGARASRDATPQDPGVPSAAASKAAAGAADGPKPAQALPQTGTQFKAPGIVTGVAGRSEVTILIAEPLYPNPRPVTFAITAQTAFLSGGVPIPATILRVGSHIGFVATRTGPDSFRLDLIETKPDVGSSSGSQQSKTPAAGVNASAGTAIPSVGGTVQGKGMLVAISSGAVSLDVQGGPLAGQTLSLVVTPTTQFVAAGQQCNPTGLPAGTPVGFTATRTGSTSYRLDQLGF